MKRWQWLKWISLWSMFAVLLTGCMYPKDRLPQNQLPPADQVSLVQKGIDQYQKDTKVLPILTKEMETPIYEKYVIDFSKMVPKYIPYVPGAAFEEGGRYLFVLIDVETKPTVKLLDLRLVDKVGEVQSHVNHFYHDKKSLPVAKVVKQGYFTINPKLIGYTEDSLTVESPFSGKLLPLIMTSTGVVGIDYAKDIELMLKSNQIQFPEGKDVRVVLPANSLYVPAKSFPYLLNNGKLELADFKK